MGEVFDFSTRERILTPEPAPLPATNVAPITTYPFAHARALLAQDHDEFDETSRRLREREAHRQALKNQPAEKKGGPRHA